ncbi:hypothetical protein BHL79_08540, partial [Limosilactobacillus reuteri]|uniref:hypothetical protein n=1 Tax=Limosilactobacillus reuteri TaxID=1598 RepID=UPI000A2E7980
HDISLDGQEMRNQMIENFKAIEQEDKDDDQALADEVADRKKGDDAEKAARQSADDDLEKRIKKLEDNSATRDEVEAAKSYMDHKAERVAWGSDGSTFITMLTRALEDTQMQELIQNIIKG